MISKEIKMPIEPNSTSKKDKWWIFLIFFLIGILSFFISVMLGNVFLLPLLICSILFAIAMYAFKKQSFEFALMIFVVSFAISSLIFFIGNLGGGFLGVVFASLCPLLILLVLFVTVLVVFKERPLIIFSLKAFVVSFGTIFIIFSAVFMPNSFLSLLVFFGPQEDATTSTSIYIESSAENLTIYIPVLLGENKNVLKMYKTTGITSNVTTAVIDTEYGKAFMIRRSGSGNHLFNWNAVPGKDTDRFMRWLEGMGDVQSGEKPDISKTDDGRAVIVSGRSTMMYQLNEKGILEFYGVNNNEIHEIFGEDLFFSKEENGQLNIYAGKNAINVVEKHGILKEDPPSFDEFLKGFTISMSNYTSPESFIQQIDPELCNIDAWVYSDSEVEKVRFSYSLDPGNRINREILSISTKGGVYLRKGWQVVNLSVQMRSWD
ncbi:MAG: hypothetical protein ACT6FE_01370 [Methanosarcinaceae archaeon]